MTRTARSTLGRPWWSWAIGTFSTVACDSGVVRFAPIACEEPRPTPSQAIEGELGVAFGPGGFETGGREPIADNSIVENAPCIDPVKPATVNDRGASAFQRRISDGEEESASSGFKRGRSHRRSARTRLALAEAGEYEALVTILKETNWSILDVDEIWGLVLRAMEVRAKQDPERFRGGHLRRDGEPLQLYVDACSLLPQPSHRTPRADDAGRATMPGSTSTSYEDHVPKTAGASGSRHRTLPGSGPPPPGPGSWAPPREDQERQGRTGVVTPAPESRRPRGRGPDQGRAGERCRRPRADERNLCSRTVT